MHAHAGARRCDSLAMMGDASPATVAQPGWRLYLDAAILYATFEIMSGSMTRYVAPHLPRSAVGALLVECITLAVAVSLVLLASRFLGRQDRGARRARGWSAAAGSVFETFFFLGLLAFAFRILDPDLDVREFASRGLGSTEGLWRFLIALPPGVAAEEILFRSVQERLRNAIGPEPAAVSVALCFSLYHMTGSFSVTAGTVIVLVATTAGGWLLARLYETSGSVGLLIAVHLGYDYMAVAQGWLNVQQRRLTESALLAGWLLVAGLMACFLRFVRAGGGPRGLEGKTELRPSGTGESIEEDEPGAGRTAPCEGAAIPARPIPGRRGVRIAASLLFGAGLPAIVKWIRWSL